jgi:hypothetical protein
VNGVALVRMPSAPLARSRAYHLRELSIFERHDYTDSPASNFCTSAITC